MTMKVIYVSSNMRLSDKVSRDWYIDFLIAKGVTVEYWDLVALLHGELNGFGAKTTDYLRTFRTYGEVEAMLGLPENRDACYVMLFYYDGYGAGIFRLLSKHGCRMLFIAWGGHPIKRVQKWRRVLSGLSNPLRLAEQVFYKAKAIAYRKMKLVKPFDIVFAAGQVLMAENLYGTKVVPINLCDYDHYREARVEAGRLVEGRYAIFLDVYLPHHPDLEIIGGPAVDPRDYYASLDRFFEFLEVKYRIKVVIAAHPTADYRVDPFHGREMYQGQTPRLVRDADFVISHHSTSLSYAVLNHKPVIFIYTNEMMSSCRHTVVKYLYDFAGYLDATIYNIDEIIQGDQIIVRDVNSRCYEDYKYGFLTTHESECASTQDIFWREINTKQSQWNQRAEAGC